MMTDVATKFGSHYALRRYWLVNALQFTCVLGILVAGITAYSLEQRVRVASESIEQTLAFKNNVHALLGSLQKAESGQRGYLLSRNLDYLEPYQAALKELGPQLDIVRRNILGNSPLLQSPDQKERLSKIVDLTENKVRELANGVEMARRGGFDQAVDLLNSDVGEKTMAQIRGFAERFQLEKNLLLQSQQTEERAASEQLFTTILVALFIVVLFGAIAVMINVRHIDAIRKSELALKEANIRLEERVQERTSELEASNEALTAEKNRTEALLKDLNHRVGNSLQLVSAFLGMQESSTASKEAKSALLAARSRVMAIASTQRRLRIGTDNETCDAGELVADLVEDLRATVPAGTGLVMHYEGNSIRLPARDAVSLGVIVGELVTNCLKYAFPEDRDGSIEISLAKDGEGTAVLRVADDGVGSPAEAASEGLGTRIVTTLAESIGGTIDRTSAAGGGTVISVRFAVAETETGAMPTA